MATAANVPHPDKELDLSNASRGVWLVKVVSLWKAILFRAALKIKQSPNVAMGFQVPKYISQKWEKAPGHVEVGKLRITKWVTWSHLESSSMSRFDFYVYPTFLCRSIGQKAVVTLAMSDSLLAEEGGEAAIPKDHRLDVQIVERQMLGVFSHSAG